MDENTNQNVEITKKKGINLIPIVLIIVAVIATISVANSPERRAQKQLELAEHYLAELNYEEAVAAYKAVLEIDPKNVDAYFGLAEAYIEIGDYKSMEDILAIG